MKPARAVPVLMYHHVSPHPGLVTVSPHTFEQQMARLARGGYTALTAGRFLSFLKGERTVPDKSVLITFDDGFLDNYVHAFPVLQRLGLHAVIFAVTGWIGEGDPRPHAGEAGGAGLPDCPNHKECAQAIAGGRADDVMLRWSEIARMEASGAVEIHSHTHSHLRWDQLYPDRDVRLAKVEEDLRRSRDALRARLGRADIHLCWPWGYFEPEYQLIASELGFTAQYTVAKGLNRPGDDPRHIHRIVVKDRAGSWLPSRLRIYRQPWLGGLYLKLRGQ
ncbi:MAG: polysaccharide deacetylase family protein [Sulfuricella sp.]|jgi:peptidoglycan/xylan/chitin deacetylase (PgdA/CDA1 family)|nr:polysaccharide deacetylase family protein [Sulfuricella sp.]